MAVFETQKQLKSRLLQEGVQGLVEDEAALGQLVETSQPAPLVDDPYRTKTAYEQALANKTEPYPGGGFQMWRDAYEMETTVGVAAEWMNRPEFPENVEFYVEDHLEDLTKDLAHSEKMAAMSLLPQAVSREHAHYLIARAQHEVAINDDLAQQGWTGLGARIGAAFMDPAAYALALASGGVSAGLKGKRLVQAVRSGLLTGAENAVLESVLAGQQATRDHNDVLLAAFAGVALGSASGAAFYRKGRKLDPVTGEDTRTVSDFTADQIETQMAATDGELTRAVAGDVVGTKPTTAFKGALRDIAELQAEADGFTPAEYGLRVPDESPPIPGRAVEIEGRFAEIEARMEELAVAEPGARKADPTDLDAKRAEVEALGEVDRTNPNAMMAANKATRGYLRAVQVLDPEGFVDSGVSRNLGYGEEWLEFVKGPAARQMHTRAKRAQADTKRAYDDELDEMDIEVAQLNLEREGLERELSELETGTGDAGAALNLAPLSAKKLLADGVPEDIANEAPNLHRTMRGGIGVHARLAKSENPYVRWINSRLTEETIGKQGDGVSQISAFESVENMTKTHEARIYSVQRQDIKKWAKDKGYARWTADWVPSRRREFFEDVSDYIETGKADSEHVARTAEAMQESFREIKDAAERWGVQGFENFPTRSDYLPRVISRTKLFNAIHQVGPDNIIRLIREGIKRAQPGIDERALEMISKKYFDNTRARQIGGGGRFFNIAADTKEQVEQLLREMEMDADDIEYVTTALERAGTFGTEGSRMARAKTRLLMDLDTEVYFPTSGTVAEARTMRLRDIYDRDAERLHGSYLRHVGGMASIAQQTHGTSRHITSVKDFEKLLGEAAEYNAAKGLAEPTDELRALRAMWDAVNGNPVNVDPTSLWTRSRRLVGGFNFATTMGQVAYAQIAEIGQIMAFSNWKSMMMHMPAVRQTFSRAANGTLENEAMAEMELFVGLGTDWLRSAGVWNWDEGVGLLSRNHEGRLDRYMGRAQTVVSGVQRAVAAPMHMITGWEHRINMLLMGQKMTSWAMGDLKFGNGQMRHLRAAGFSDKNLEDIKANIQKHATLEDSLVSRNKLHKLNLEKWTPEARESFTMGLFRMGRRIIQENDPGAQQLWMHNNVGKMLTQFRSFGITAWNKQLLYGLTHADTQQGLAWSLSMLMGGMAYVVREYDRAALLSESERAQQLRERLSPENLAKASFNRAGFSSLLPMVWDSGAMLTGNEPAFSYRTTDLASNMVTGNPTMRSLEAFTGLMQSAGSAFNDGRQFSKRDLRDIKSLTPFGTFFGVTNLFQHMGKDLPNKSDLF